MSENMISIKRKANYKTILEHFRKHTPWSEEEKKIPITQSVWFTQLIMLITTHNRSGINKEAIAYEIFGTMCSYINRNYSIEPAKDLLASLEQNSIRIGTPNDLSFLITLIDNICQTGYQRCGTSTLAPFIAWFHSCDISLQEIRETLMMEHQANNEKAIEKQSKDEKKPKKRVAKKSATTKKKALKRKRTNNS